ncbi:MAG: insulinase family protein [Nannocystis sp.]|nr:pitrilysin family protein [Nannocystis sp.]MBA3549335.1 insulinase family protein [Nannocystis sp.]
MSKFPLALPLVAALLSPAVAGAAPAPPLPKVPVEKFTLPNGLRVVLSEDHSAPVVTVYTVFRVGGANEVKGSTGFAHLFEHMMFNGSRNVPEGAYAYYVDATGGDVNANTEHDRTNYFQTVPSNYLEGILYLEANRMANLEITERALDNEKSVVKEEVRQQQENSPYAKVLMLDWPAVAYSSWEYAHSMYGSMEDLSNAPVQAFVDFFKKYYVPNNATLVICGDFEPKQARALIERHYGGLKAGPELPRSFPQEATQTAAVYKQVEDPLAPTPLALISFDIPAPRTADHNALELLATVLTNGASSRMQKLLVDDKKLASMALMQPGFPWTTYGPSQMVALLIASKDTKLVDLRAAFWAELEQVRNDGVTPAEITRARSKLYKQHVDTLGSTLYKAMQLGTYEAFFGGAEKFSGDLKRFDKLTPADLKRVAAQYLGEPSSVTFDIVPGQKS